MKKLCFPQIIAACSWIAAEIQDAWGLELCFPDRDQGKGLNKGFSFAWGGFWESVVGFEIGEVDAALVEMCHRKAQTDVVEGSQGHRAQRHQQEDPAGQRLSARQWSWHLDYQVFEKPGCRAGASVPLAS